MQSVKTRAVVVGAGAAGLAVAHELRERGVRDVVVLEQGPAAGGKCSTLHYEGRAYELGAGIVTPAYRRVRRLMDEYGVAASLRTSAAYLGADGRARRGQFGPPSLGLSGKLRLVNQVRRVLSGELSHQLRAFPRVDASPPEWSEPFAAYCERHDYCELLEVVRGYATAFGYGYMEDVPAAYMLNYLCVYGPTFELLTTGFGGLWERVARSLDVRTDCRVERVQRGEHGVRVETSRGAFEADELVLACPLDLALSYLDASDEERGLFSRIRTMDYQTITLDTTGMRSDAYLFVPEHFAKDAAGRPMFCYRRFRETGVIGFYSFAGTGGLDGAEHEACNMVQRMGGRVKKVLARRAWRYFPHVSSHDFAAGFHARLEALQGRRRTYYTGELTAFSCVEAVVARSQMLAAQMLRPRSVLSPRELPFFEVANDQARLRKAVNE
jgi:predicted NAD/FAD-binding protein